MKKLPVNILTLGLFVFFTAILLLRAEGPTAAELSVKLDALKETIVTEVTTALQATAPKTSYTIVWRDYEDAAIDALCIVLKKHVESLADRSFDRGKSGKEKNRLADLAIVCGGEQIEISIKTARRSANPENDMGTFREHPSRHKLFVASFTLWVRYDDSGKTIKTDRVFFDRTWRLVGKSSLVDGVKYRKKDGNMRPKPWAMFDSVTAYWKTEEEFEAAVKRSEVYRANELINEHLRELSDEDQRLLYERLQKKFGEKKTTGQ